MIRCKILICLTLMSLVRECESTKTFSFPDSIIFQSLELFPFDLFLSFEQNKTPIVFERYEYKDFNAESANRGRQK
jgi:hypothetical protein